MSLLVLGAAVLMVSAGVPTAVETPVVREKRPVQVAGRSEVWALEWQVPPERHCMTSDPGDFECRDFAYGEIGRMRLVRYLRGKEIDSLPLDPLFRDPDELDEPPLTKLKRWPVKKDELQRERADKVLPRILRRQNVTIMDLKDYNRDGQATEFVLVVSNEYGRRLSILIGLDAKADRLKVFASKDNPDRPLVLRAPTLWEELRKRKSLKDWRPCDVRESDDVSLEVWIRDGQFAGVEVRESCERKDEPARKSAL